MNALPDVRCPARREANELGPMASPETPSATPCVPEDDPTRDSWDAVEEKLLAMQYDTDQGPGPNGPSELLLFCDVPEVSTSVPEGADVPQPPPASSDSVQYPMPDRVQEGLDGPVTVTVTVTQGECSADATSCLRMPSLPPQPVLRG